jgi:two-component system, cell cycle sensor histidine kinase and response regulator CckA
MLQELQVTARRISGGLRAMAPGSDAGEPHALVAGPRAEGAGRSRVLVVEDESAVRMLIARVLETAGYAVLHVGDGAQALELLEREWLGVDLVLTDIRMPRLDGLELGRRIAAQEWPIPVLYMSADPPDALAGGGTGPATAPCLQKPFSVRALVAAVDGVLNDAH